VAQRFREPFRRLVIAFARRRTFHDRRPVGEVLQVALANQRGAIAGVAQQIDEGHRVHRQRDAVASHAVDRGHASRHQAGAVRLAYRACDIEFIERRALGRDRIDVGRAQHRMAVAAEEIGAVLVGDEQEEVGP
jgi:hypothetical protein